MGRRDVDYNKMTSYSALQSRQHNVGNGGIMLPQQIERGTCNEMGKN